MWTGSWRARSKSASSQLHSFWVDPAGPAQARDPNRLDVKEWLVYRSALNAREAAALHESKLLQASLEIHAPLDDAVFATGEPVQNRAQSVSEARVGAGSATHGEE